MNKLTIIFCFFLFVCFASYSQNYNVKKYGTKDGLLLNQTSKLFQDEKGFLWVVYSTGNWQIFDDKKFTTIHNKGSFSFDYQFSGDNVFSWAHYGYYIINNYQPKFYKVDTALYESYSREHGFSNINPRALNNKGEVFIVKLLKGISNNTLNDTIFKVYKNSVKKIPFKDFKNDSSVHLEFKASDGDNIWIMAHKTKEYNCVGLYKIKNDKIIKQPYCPNGEINAILDGKKGVTWLLYQSIINRHYYVAMLKSSKLEKEYDLGMQDDIRPRLRLDSNANLWIPNLTGLVKIDPNKMQPDFFEDKERQIKTIQINAEELGQKKSFTKSCDENNYSIAITKKNEVLIGNKIFTPEKGFKTIIDNTILGPGSIRQTFIDSEDNIWYVGNGLLKLSPSVIETAPIRQNTTILYANKFDFLFSVYFNEAKKKSVILAFNKAGILQDSIIIEPTQNYSINFLDVKDGSVLCVSRSYFKREFIYFNGLFKNIDSKICEVVTKPKNEAIEFVDEQSNLIYLNNNRVYKLNGVFMEDITQKIKAPIFFKPSFWGHWRGSKTNFSGVVDSLGIYEFDNGSFQFTPFKGLEKSRSEPPIRIVQFPNNLQQFVILHLDQRKIFVYCDHKIREVKCLNKIERAQMDFYPKVSSWLNDTVLLGNYDNGFVKYSFSKNLKQVSIEKIVPKGSEEEISDKFNSVNTLMFARPFLQDIKYFYKDSLLNNNLTLYSINNSAVKGDFFESTGKEFFDDQTGIYYFKDAQTTSFIDFTKLKPNLKEPILNIYQASFSSSDSILTFSPTNLIPELPYNFNPLKIFYRGICTTDGPKVKYKYFLSGLDNKWQETTEDFIIYSSLPPGNYTFKVIACNNDGIWNKKPAEMSFTVLSPWYRTSVAYCFYLGISIICILLYIKWRERTLRVEKEILEQTVEKRTEELVQKNIIVEQQKHLVEEKHKEITDSINYAERIQRALLAGKKLLDENLNNYFILFKPKDIVSGDFYWATKLSNSNFVFVTADSTGHGVPGAIMSIINMASLKEASMQGIISPDLLLNETRRLIIENLKNDGSAEGGKDGMDGSLLSFDFKNNVLNCASANNPIWIIRKKELIEIKADRIPIGKHDKDKTPFTLHTLDLIKGDVIYTLTDGFPDQFGGANGKKFKYKQLQELLLSIAIEPMETQKQKLNDVFDMWRGNLEQVDDVCLIGVRI